MQIRHANIAWHILWQWQWAAPWEGKSDSSEVCMYVCIMQNTHPASQPTNPALWVWDFSFSPPCVFYSSLLFAPLFFFSFLTLTGIKTAEWIELFTFSGCVHGVSQSAGLHVHGHVVDNQHQRTDCKDKDKISMEMWLISYARSLPLTGSPHSEQHKTENQIHGTGELHCMLLTVFTVLTMLSC